MYYIGIDVGGMSIKGGISKGDQKISNKKSLPTIPQNGYSAFLEDIITLIHMLSEAEGVSAEDIDGVGIGIPGTVSDGVIINAPNIGLNSVPLAKDLQDKTGLNVRIENDANCAALCEYKFGEHTSDNLLLVTIGTGIGTGIICGGQLVSGFNGIGGEGGHMVIRANGKKCACGRHGCFEQYASTSALLRKTAEAAKKYPDSVLAQLCAKSLDGFTIFNALDKGCPVAQQVMTKYIDDLAIGIANFVNILGTQTVLIGGGISAEEQKLIYPLKERLDMQLNRNIKNGIHVDLYRATFGNDAGILGAIATLLI